MRQLLRTRDTWRGTVQLTLAFCAYGSLVVFIKAAVAAGINTQTALVLRFGIAALIWSIILLAKGQLKWPGSRLGLQTLAIGAFLYGSNSATYYIGTARTSGSLAAIVLAMVPVVVAVLSQILLGERLGWIGWLALALAMGGSVLVAGAPTGRVDPEGLLWLGAAILLFALSIVCSKPVTQALSIPLGSFYIALGASLFHGVVGGLSRQLRFAFPPQGWLAVVGLAIFPTVMGTGGMLSGLSLVGATVTGILSTLEPVTGVVLSVLLLGEQLSPRQIVGSAVVLAAAVLVHLERSRSQADDGANGNGNTS